MAKDTELERDIEWFESKDPTLKEGMVEDPFEFDENEQERFFHIIRKARSALEENNNSKEKTIEFLVNNGMSTTYAPVIVDKVIEKVPPPSLTFPHLEKLEYKDFETFMNRFIDLYYTDQLPDELVDELVDESGIDESIVSGLANELVSLLNKYLRGQTVLSKIIQDLTSNGLSKDRAEFITKLFRKNESEISKKLMFSNIQDILFYEIDRVKKRQDRIEELLLQVLDLLKKEEKEE